MSIGIDFDKESPFQPGTPVSPNKFKGRENTVNKILRYCKNSINGETQHFFLTGKRRMGKTSLGYYVKNYVEMNFNMVGVYVSNKGNHSLEKLTSEIIEALLNELSKESVSKKIKNLFKEHVEVLSLDKLRFIIKPDNITSNYFKENFAKCLKGIYDEFDDKKGLFVVIDDVNGLSESSEFVDWYKNFADSVAVSNENLPVYLLLMSYPEDYDNLVLNEVSFGSIFNNDNIDVLRNCEVEKFFIDTFKEKSMEIDEDAIKILVKYSLGLPLLMQQIGECVFWNVDTVRISKYDVIGGVFDAIHELSNKQIKSVLKEISKEYDDILKFLGKNELSVFEKKQLMDELNLSEDFVNGFLEKMIELEVFEIENKASEIYKFNNLLYAYYWIKSLEKVLL